MPILMELDKNFDRFFCGLIDLFAELNGLGGFELFDRIEKGPIEVENHVINRPRGKRRGRRQNTKNKT